MYRKQNAITSGPIPKYRQLLILLRDQILSGELEPGARMPSEEDLTGAYSLSRGTVRKAIAQLEAERLIETEHGVGSFVRTLHPRAIPFRFLALPEPDARYEVLAQEIIAAPVDVAEKLQLTPGDSVIHIARRKFLAGRPVSYSERFLRKEILPALVHQDLTQVGSIHALLESASDFPLLKAELEIEAHRLDGEEASLLQAEPGTAAIAINRITYTAPNRPAVLYGGLFIDHYQTGVSIS